MRRLAGAGRWKDAIKVWIYGLGEKHWSNEFIAGHPLQRKESWCCSARCTLNWRLHTPPDAYTSNIFCQWLVQCSKDDEAMWTIQEMKGCSFHPSVITYSTILQAHCNQFNFSKAYDLLDEMAADGCPPNVVTYTTIMHSLAKSRKFEEALLIAEKMKLSGCKPGTLFCNSLISILGSAGQLR